MSGLHRSGKKACVTTQGCWGQSEGVGCSLYYPDRFRGTIWFVGDHFDQYNLRREPFDGTQGHGGHFDGGTMIEEHGSGKSGEKR